MRRISKVAPDPFTMSDHMVDDHGLSDLLVDSMDNDQLKGLHDWEHQRSHSDHQHDG